MRRLAGECAGQLEEGVVDVGADRSQSFEVVQQGECLLDDPALLPR